MTTTELASNAHNIMIALVYIAVAMVMLALIIGIVRGLIRTVSPQGKEKRSPQPAPPRKPGRKELNDE